MKRIAELYKIEAEIRGLIPENRLAIRQDQSAPKIVDFETWLTHHRARVSAKSPLGEALKYIAKYWAGPCRFLVDGRIEMDSNAVERTIRPITLNRKNALFAGHDAGAENWATIAPLVETCKLCLQTVRGAPSHRQRRDMVLLAHIRDQHRLSLGSCGRPRMTAELNELGFRVGQRRVGRLMRQNGIQVIRSRTFKRTTDSDNAFNIAPNFLRQDFATSGLNQKWAGDIT